MATMKTYKRIKKTPATQILIRAQAIISEGWTKHEFAKDKKGRPVNAGDENACKFCALGALDRAAIELGYGISTARGSFLQEAFSRLESLVGEETIMTINDRKGTKKEHMFDLFTLAILEGK